MNTPLLLCYRIEEDICIELKKLAKPFGVSLRRVPPSAYELPIGAVVAGMEGKSSPLVPDLPEGMLVFANFPEVMLDAFLGGMKKRQIRVPLKAVITKHNAAWTAHTLYRELLAEREAIQKKRGQNDER